MSVAGATNVDLEVTIGGKVISKTEVHEISVERDLDAPDFAVVVLSNESTLYSEKITEGDDLVVKLGLAGASQATAVFHGEVIGIEPVYETSSKRRVIIRALNKLHALARGKKSVAYTKCTDKQIVDQIAGNYSLTADYGQTPPSTQYDHVYQHNQSDLEFIRLRAARIGYEVLVDDTKLSFRKRDSSDSGIKLLFSGSGGLITFRPRLSTVNQVSEVKVRGYDPVNKKEIVGIAQPQTSKLGDKHGSKVAGGKHPNVYAFTCDVPIASKAEADAIAGAILEDRLMSFVTGDAVSKGNPDLKPGIVVTIDADDKKFNGKYYIVAVRHRYRPSGPTGGYRTEFKFKRDAILNPQASQQQQAAATSPAAPPPPPPAQPQKQPETAWIEVKMIGEDGAPIAGLKYKLKLASGEEVEGELDDQGTVRLDGIDAGSCELSFPDLDQDAWEQT